MKVRIKYHADIPKLRSAHAGEWIDLYAAEDTFIPLEEYRLISLGVSIELPEGYEAIVAPRSSTFKNFGLVCSCSFGVIDNLYKGDNDIWMFPAICKKDMTNKEADFARQGTQIHRGDRIAQFRIQEQQIQFDFEEVESLGNPDRGGIGSTGKR